MDVIEIGEWCKVVIEKNRVGASERAMMRETFVLFGDSITQESFRENGWGASLANSYSRKLRFFFLFLKKLKLYQIYFVFSVVINKS